MLGTFYNKLQSAFSNETGSKTNINIVIMEFIQKPANSLF